MVDNQQPSHEPEEELDLEVALLLSVKNKMNEVLPERAEVTDVMLLFFLPTLYLSRKSLAGSTNGLMTCCTT